MKIKSFILFLAMTALLSSCYTTQVTVGDMPFRAKTERYSKSKQFYLFWGIIPLGENDPRAPSGQDAYVVESKFKFGDFLISGLTGGIVGARTSTVFVEKE
ncbi:MAG: Bor/Iss family lipoprotein [Crocinitomicaceae bacterium]